MANKSTFTPEQWDKVVQAPLLAGFAISAGDPSGLIGMFQEGAASATALAAARGDNDELIKAVVEELLTPEGRAAAREGVQRVIQDAPIAEIRLRTLEELRSTAKILDVAAPLDSRPFKNWLNHIATVVAEAAHEGGLLGFGGVKVSEAERATLSDIALALNA